jgi:hypothetical protein
MPFVIILGFIALFVVLWLVGAAAQRRRREAMAAWAAARGLSFRTEDIDGAPPGCSGFELLQRGRSRCASNCSTGRIASVAVTAFDWRYVTGSGKNRTTHNCSAVVLQPGARLGGLRIREEHLFDKLCEMFSFNDMVILPCTTGNRPVRMLARFGVQIGDVA